MRTVSVANRYSYSPDKLWDIATRYDALGEISGRAVSFRGLPTGELKEGQSVDASISLLGLLPRQQYHIRIIERDDKKMILRSSEHGAGVKFWRHTVLILKSCGGSLLVDTVEVEAGWLTIPAALWANFLYRKRHWPRLKLLRKLAQNT